MARTQTEMKVCLILDHYNLYKIPLNMALVLHCSTHDFASIIYMHKWLKEFSFSLSQFQPLIHWNLTLCIYIPGLIVQLNLICFVLDDCSIAFPS